MRVGTVCLALPFRPGWAVANLEAYAVGCAGHATRQGDLATAVSAPAYWPYAVLPAMCSTSLIPFTFNTIWAGALNKRREHGLTHFAMMHDDIRPARGWLDVLLGEMEATGADVVSAVVPIKDARGLTSTALDDTGDYWMPRRLSLKEVFALPETFTDPAILLNTGLFVCRLDRPWCERVFFEQADRVVRAPDGEFVAQTASEDWNFSRAVRAGGGTLYATRKVRLEHERPQWTNARPWGTLAADEPVGRTEMAELAAP